MNVPKIVFVIASFLDDFSKALLNNILTSEMDKIYFGEKVYIISQIKFIKSIFNIISEINVTRKA